MTDLALTTGAPAGHVAGVSWLQALRRFLVFIALANLAWEFAQMPLYTLWYEGTAGEIIFAAVHRWRHPDRQRLAAARVPARGQARMARGDLQTRSGAHHRFCAPLHRVQRMAQHRRPRQLGLLGGDAVVPLLDAGLAPLAQWIVIPIAAFWWAHRPGSSASPKSSK